MKLFRWQLAVFLLGVTLVGVLYQTGRRAEVAGGTASSGQIRPVALPAAAEFQEVPSGDDDRCTDDGLLRGGVVVEGVVGRPQSLNPLLADGNPVDEAVTELVFDGLTAIDEGDRVVPGLAAGWNVADDGRTVVLTLKEGLTWHDGVPVTSADVAFTYALLQDPLINENLADGGIWRHMTVETLDDLTVRITLDAPFSPFLRAASRGILPAHQLEGVTAADLADHPFNNRPIGTGPFWVANSWPEDGFLMLAPVLPQWANQPLLDRLQIRFYADSDALLQAFAAGDVQLTGPLDAAAVPHFLRVDRSSVITGYAPIMTQLMFNMTDSGSPAVQDKAVRQALAQLIDPGALMEAHLDGQGIPLVGPFLSGSWVNIPQDVPTIEPEGRKTAAEERLTTAGWLLPSEDEESDGIRRLGETLLVVNVLVPDEPDKVALANGLVEQWEAAGGRFAVEVVDQAAYRSRLQDRRFDAVLVDLAMSAGPDLYDFWSQEAIVRGQNFAGWNHRRASEALEAARQTWPEESRRQFYQAFWEFFQSELPAVTLYQRMTVFAYSDTIEGLEAGPVYNERDRLSAFDGWSLPSNRDASFCRQE